MCGRGRGGLAGSEGAGSVTGGVTDMHADKDTCKLAIAGKEGGWQSEL